MKLKVAGDKQPEGDFVDAAKKWMRSVKMTGEVILAVSKRTLFIIGKEDDPYPWVCFWDPSTNSIKGGMGIVRFYDWDVLPKRLKNGVKETFSVWKAQGQFHD